jgi:Family of unknown function (DUF6169)
MVEKLKISNHKKTVPLSDRSEIIPYDLISQEGTEVSYTFITEHDIQYVVRYVSSTDYYFDETSDIGDTEILEFQFAPIDKGIKPVKDLRIAETLATSMKNVLSANKNAILYICDKSDGKQAARSKLFDKWYKNYSWEMVEKHDGKLVYQDSPESEYVSLIVNITNPYANNVIEAFSFIMESDK